MQNILIFTVGTGTAGKHSNLAQGLVNAFLKASQPEAVFLLPSTTEDSLTIATLVQERLREIITGLAVEILQTFANPDDLPRCRRDMCLCLEQIKARLPGRRLVLNPTSGTKQMTAAAVLAAIDTEVGNLEFIAGERADGVVMTGSERLTAVSMRRILAAKTATHARTLFAAGAYAGAEALLRDWQAELPQLWHAARTLAAWDRFAYGRACQAAASWNFSDSKRVRRALQELVSAGNLSFWRVADMLQYAQRALAQERPEDALAVLYRCVELCGRIRLQELGVKPDENDPEAIIANPQLHFKGNRNLTDQLRSIARHGAGGGSLYLGMRIILELLNYTKFPIVEAVLRDKANWNTIQSRNSTRYGHGTDPVDAAAVRRLAADIFTAAVEQWPELASLHQHCAFPDTTVIFAEENQ